MKLTDEPDEISLDHYAKIQKAIPDSDDLCGILTTLLGVTDNLCQYIMDKNAKTIWDLPNDVKYSLFHMHQFLTLFSKILRDELKDDEKVIMGGHFPVGGESWKTDKDFEKRLILIVKIYHKHLKDEGKL